MSKSNNKAQVMNGKPIKKKNPDSESDDEPVKKTASKVETKKSVMEDSDSESDDEPVKKTASKVETRKPVSSKSKTQVQSDSDDEQVSTKVQGTKATEKKSDKEPEDDSDDSDDEQQEKGIISDASDEESEDDKTTRGKKVKETFDAVKSRIKSRKQEIKELYKTKNEQLKGLKETEVNIKNMERNQRIDYDQLEKSHDSDLKRVRSEKPKRKGNVNGGFNREQPVPEVLRKFLNLADDAALPRPKVVAALHNKFKELQLKDKQMTKIDMKTATKLGLDAPVDIPFGKFQTWLASFYPKVETKVEVVV